MPQARPAQRWLEYHDPEDTAAEGPEIAFTAVIDQPAVPDGGFVLAVNRSDRDWYVYVRTAPGEPHGEPIARVPANSEMRVWGRTEG